MGDAELRRIREDLATIQQAVGAGLPFGWPDVWMNLAVAGLGAALFTASAWLLGRPPLYTSAAIIAALVLVAAINGWVTARCRRERDLHPVRWREYRGSALFGFVSAPLLVVFFFVASRAGIPWHGLTGMCLFMMGIAAMLPPLMDRTRQYMLGHAVGFMVGGTIFVSGELRAGLAIGAWLGLAGALTAGIMVWQMRDTGPGAAHAAD